MGGGGAPPAQFIFEAGALAEQRRDCRAQYRAPKNPAARHRGESGVACGATELGPFEQSATSLVEHRCCLRSSIGFGDLSAACDVSRGTRALATAPDASCGSRH